MPEKKDTIEVTNEQTSEAQAPASPPPARSSSMAILLSSLALLLAAFALAATLISNKNMGTRQPLTDIQGKLNTIENRVDKVEASMATNKRDMVQAELKKMLLNLREMSQLGDNETKSEISKAEAILKRLSSPKTRVKAKVDLQSAEQATAVEPEKTQATVAPTPSESPKEPATQEKVQAEQKTEMITTPATMPAETGEKNPPQDKTATKAGKITPETTPEATQADEKSVSEKPAETPGQPVHEESATPRTKAPDNPEPGTAGKS